MLKSLSDIFCYQDKIPLVHKREKRNKQKLLNKENADAERKLRQGVDFRFGAEAYSITWIAPEGHWHSQARQTKHSSTLAGEDLPSLTS